MSKICLVTSSLVGPTLNGGVGTAIYHLAVTLQKAGNDITILFNGNIAVKNERFWTERYKKIGINFVYLPSLNYTADTIIGDTNWWIWRSYFSFQYLKRESFDIIHFPETCGYAFHTIQAKRTTEFFQNTKIVITMHSPTEWIYDGMEIWPLEEGSKERYNLLFLKLCYAERYCCQYCDYLLAPSKAMFEWALERNWKLCSERKVLFNAYVSSKSYSELANLDYNHIIFFGRLEKRKGLDIFCSAVTELYNNLSKQNINLKISFLGKESTVDGIPAIEYIHTHLPQTAEVIIHTDFDTFAAMDYIKNSKGICVMSSLNDNSPYSIVECIENHIPFICSDVGGIPELVDSHVLFECSSASLYQKLIKIRELDFSQITHKYDATIANEALVKFHDSIIKDLPKEQDPFVLPLVSICIAYKKQVLFIYDLLESLFENTYPNFEVILAYDVNVPNEFKISEAIIQKKFGNKHKIRFIPHNPMTKGEALNLCAQNANGSYLIFLNAENYVKKDFISSFVFGVRNSKEELLSSISISLKGVGYPQITELTPEMLLIPTGTNSELSYFENCYSGSSFIISKSLFYKVGMFVKSTDAATEWAFMNHLILNNYQVDIIPLPLYWERDVDPQLDLTYNKTIFYHDHQNALKELYSSYGDGFRYFLTNWCIGRFYEEYSIKKEPSRINYNIYKSDDTQRLSATADITNLKRQIAILQAAIDNYENATFWKMTAPLRKCCDFLRKFRK